MVFIIISRSFTLFQKSIVTELCLRKGVIIELFCHIIVLGISRQSVQAMEIREMEGSITLQALNEAAKSMDMKLVYGFIPIDGSLDALITRKSYQLAAEIVGRTSNTMKLENQENSNERIKKAIDERAQQLKNDLPKMLWD